MQNQVIATLEQALGYKFKSKDLITEALTHRSYRHESGREFDNERLEFLGDAVLDLCVSEAIMGHFNDKREGQLSKIRSQLVSEGNLAINAARIALGDSLFLGKGEELSGGRTRASIMADTLEAVIAAIYLDGGLESVRKAIHKIFELDKPEKISWEHAVTLLNQDTKSKLQETFQSHGYPAPTYSCVKIHGPEHSRVFVMGLFVAGFELIRAKGNTKKEATQKAAKDFLHKLEVEKIDLEKMLQDKNVKLTPRVPKKVAKKASSDKREKARTQRTAAEAEKKAALQNEKSEQEAQK
jgi:ribonuclease-3